MCTAMTMQTSEGNIFFGRTMDFSYPLSPEMYFVPRGYRWHNILNTHQIHTTYSFMGIGQNISPVVFADGVNEMGFAVAALYFPGYAQYDAIRPPDFKTPDIAAIELVGFLLSLCDCVKQAANLIRGIRIVGIKDAVTDSIAPLHWIMADRSGACMVVEKMEDGLHLTENPIGVLSNSPDIKWQMTNLRNYMNVAPNQQQKEEWGLVALTPFGQGAGTFGLPGDYTPPSRFVRTAYQKSHVFLPDDKKGAATACFHVMESVSIPKGIVMTSRGTSDYTQYTAFIDISAQEYYFKTYDNSCISISSLRACDNQEMVSLGKLAEVLSW